LSIKSYNHRKRVNNESTSKLSLRNLFCDDTRKFILNLTHVHLNGPLKFCVNLTQDEYVKKQHRYYIKINTKNIKQFKNKL